MSAQNVTIGRDVHFHIAKAPPEVGLITRPAKVIDLVDVEVNGQVERRPRLHVGLWRGDSDHLQGSENRQALFNGGLGYAVDRAEYAEEPKAGCWSWAPVVKAQSYAVQPTAASGAEKTTAIDTAKAGEKK